MNYVWHKVPSTRLLCYRSDWFPASSSISAAPLISGHRGTYGRNNAFEIYDICIFYVQISQLVVKWKALLSFRSSFIGQFCNSDVTNKVNNVDIKGNTHTHTNRHIRNVFELIWAHLVYLSGNPLRFHNGTWPSGLSNVCGVSKLSHPHHSCQPKLISNLVTDYIVGFSPGNNCMYTTVECVAIKIYIIYMHIYIYAIA